MSRKTKIWLIIASSLIVVGCIIGGSVMAMLQWDFTKLSTVKYETNNYEIGEDYKNISIMTDTADILFVPSENSRTSVVCHEQKNLKHSVTVQNDTLTIELDDTRKWYDYIGIHFGTPKITVYLPENTYASLCVWGSTGDVDISEDFNIKKLDISISTGNICLKNTSAEALSLSVSTGNVTVRSVTCSGTVFVRVSTGDTQLTDVTCSNLRSKGSTGDISLQNVIAAEQFTIERSTGNVKLDRCDAGQLFIQTDTGDVKGSLLTDKVFLTDTDTGNVDVPKTITGGLCEIRTDTGNITISIAP